MNTIQEFNINKKKVLKIFIITMICFCLLPLIINSAALSPLKEVLSYDVVYSDSVFIYVIDYLMALFEIIAFAVTFSIIIFSVFLGSKKITSVTVILFVASLLLQIPVTILMNIPIYNTIGTIKSVLLSCIPMLAYVIFCVLHLIAIYVISLKQRRNYLLPQKRSKKNRGSDLSRAPLLPITRLYNKENPFQVCALAMGIVISAPKLILHIIGHISVGFPDGIAGIIDYVISYFSDIAYGVVAYVIALLIFSLAYDKAKESKTDETTVPSEECDVLN